MPSIPERLATLEAKQIAHEEANKTAIVSLQTKIEEVEAVAMEAREMVTQTNILVAQMPQKVTEAIKSERRGNRMELKDWIQTAAIVAGFLLTVLVAKG